MDYVTRQFINLTKRLLRNFRKAFTSLSIDLHHIKNAIQSIDKNARANQQKEQPKIEVVAFVHEPEGAETKRKAEYDRTQRRDRVRLFVEWLTFFAVVFYGYMAVRQWREQISARHQTQGAIEAAGRSAAAAEAANANASAQFREQERPYIWLTNNGVLTPEFRQVTSTVGQIIWPFNYTNFGKSPAHDVRTHKFIRIGENGVFKESFKAPVIQPGRGTPCPPGKEDYGAGVSEPFLLTEFNRLSKVDHGFTMKTVFDYTDVSGAKYQTEVCLTHLASGATQYCAGSYIH
jgi:hypothetical protein